MKGLRTRENVEFERFFELVQQEAKKLGCVFFLDASDGNEHMEKGIEFCDLMGWLIPTDEQDEFEEKWSDFSDIPEKFDDCYLWAEWKTVDGETRVSFKEYQ